MKNFFRFCILSMSTGVFLGIHAVSLSTLRDLSLDSVITNFQDKRGIKQIVKTLPIDL